MARDMGPNWAVPAMRAGGAVPEPFPSTWIFTLGYIFAKASPHSVIRLFMVSDPTLERLPETPGVFAYAAMEGSTFTAWARAGVAPRARTAIPAARRLMSASSL